MKRILILLTAIGMLTSCNESATVASDTIDSTAGQATVALPYTASYSSSFEMGNPEFSAKILSGSWKDWENNTLDNMKNWMADTIVAFQSNGETVTGLDSMMTKWKRARAKYTTVIDTVQAVLPVYSTDKKQHWVLVWAREINTNADGVKDTVSIMETWRINKDGKADYLLQYEQSRNKK